MMILITGSDIAKTSEKKKVVWISLLVFDLFNVVSQTEILKHLGKRGFDTCLIAMRSKKHINQKDPNLRLILLPIRTVPILSPFICAFALLLYLPFYVIANRPDYIITTPNASMTGLLLRLFLRPFVPNIILDIRTTPLQTEGTFRESMNAFAFRLSLIIAAKSFDGITILTESMKKDICSRFGLDRNFIGVWTSGVAKDFLRSSHGRKKMRKIFGYENKFVIFYHGAFGPDRGVDETVQAMSFLKKDFPDIVLFLLGDGPNLKELKSIIKREHLEDTVVLHGSVPYEDVPELIAMSDLGIVPLPDLPDWRNQCPLKLLEYLAMEKVVIVTDIPANRNVVGNCRCAIYVKSVNPLEISSAIIMAYQNKRELKERGACGKSIVEKEYVWDKVAEHLDYFLTTRHKRIKQSGDRL